jgi:hypothetical protein
VQIPVGPHDLTASWMTTALRAEGTIGDAAVVAVDVGPVGEVGMTGQIFRVRMRYDDAPAGAPGSVVAKLSGASPEVRDVVHSMGFYAREIGTYRELADDCPLRMPCCYFTALDEDTGDSVILLEDLTDLRQLAHTGGPVCEVERVVADLARLHATWWNDDHLSELSWLTLEGILTPGEGPGHLAQTWPTFLARLSAPITPELLATHELLLRYLEPVSTSLFHEPPLTLIHNDVHGDNLLWQEKAKSPVVFIDWQLATRARGVVDVAGFLCGHLDTEERRRHEHRLLRSYHTGLVQSGIADYPFSLCWDDYRCALLIPASRIAMAVGMHPDLTKTPGAFWDVLYPRFVAAIEDLDVADVLAARYGIALNDRPAPRLRADSR